MKNKEYLKAIRAEMSARNIDAYFIPATDPHLGEYVPSHWRIINWLTGFSGSAANVVITDKFAGLWTDSRYFIQAENELRDTGFELVKLKVPHTPEYIDWLSEYMFSGGIVAMDGRVVPIGLLKLMNTAFVSKKLVLKTDVDIINDIWTDRYPMPQGKAFEHELRFTGKSRKEKISDLRERMKEIGASHHLLTSLDDIAWLYNIRGTDVDYSPLITSFSLVGLDTALIFTDISRFGHDLHNSLESDGVSFLPYDDISSSLENIDRESSLIITPGTTSVTLYNSIPEKLRLIEEISIPTRLKAIKNSTEINHIKKVMISDGLALTRFFFWLENNIGKERITELLAADRLLQFRMQDELCIGPSFGTIAAYNEHGALPHYSSSPETDIELKPEGIFLLDSGGQYYNGTTDVTRTIALGMPTEKQKRDFTLALKGTINLAMVKFPHGTKGYQIEILARKALWDNYLNYGHGTGHGVGFFLNVHEGPQTIGTGASGDLKTILEPGMLTADEPAIYREGEYGFRTENLILCVNAEKSDYGQFYKFETVTHCYIDLSLVDINLLTLEELSWLNSYHKRVYETLGPHLEEDLAAWLKNKTRVLP